jgi:hypothetical protein
LGSFRTFEFDFDPVSQADGLKDRSHFMEPVGALVKHSQVQVELGKGRKTTAHS